MVAIPPISTPGIPESNITYSPTEENNEGGFDISKFGNLFGSMTSGDMMGMLGNYLQTKGAKDYTLAERQANLPNRTFYDDYGKDTLKTLNEEREKEGKKSYTKITKKGIAEMDSVFQAWQRINDKFIRKISNLPYLKGISKDMGQLADYLEEGEKFEIDFTI